MSEYVLYPPVFVVFHVNNGEVKQSLCGRMPLLSPTSRIRRMCGVKLNGRKKTEQLGELSGFESAEMQAPVLSH